MIRNVETWVSAPRCQGYPSRPIPVLFIQTLPIPVRPCDDLFVPAFQDLGLIFLSLIDSLDPLRVGPKLPKGSTEDSPGLT